MAILTVLFSALPPGCTEEIQGENPSKIQTNSAAQDPGVKVDNLTCPVMPEEAVPETVEPALVVVHAGRRIGFCCEDCLSEWAEWSPKRKDAFIGLIAGAN